MATKFYGADGSSPPAAAAAAAAAQSPDAGLPHTIKGLSGLVLNAPVDATLEDNVMDMDYCILHVEGTSMFFLFAMEGLKRWDLMRSRSTV